MIKQCKQCKRILSDTDIKAGMEVWIKSAVKGRPQRCIVEGGDELIGYRLRRLDGKGYRVRFPRHPSDLFATKEEAVADERD